MVRPETSAHSPGTEQAPDLTLLIAVKVLTAETCSLLRCGKPPESVLPLGSGPGSAYCAPFLKISSA